MSTTVTSVVSHFPSPQNGFTTTLASTIASGATTVPLNSVAGYTNNQVAVFIVDPSDLSKKQTFTGIIDTAGVQVTSVVWTAGTNQTHSGGATIVDYAAATHIAMMTKGLLVQHSQTGAHTAVTATSVAATGNISSSAGTVNAATVSSLQDTSIALSTYRAEYFFDYVASGGVWTGDSLATNRNASMTAITLYSNGQRLTVGAVTARTFTASKDTYIDILNTAGVGSIVYTEVTNNAASPALAANSVRIGIIVTGATTIATAGSVNQGQESSVLPIASSIAYAVTDSLGNLICPRDPNRRVLGFQQLITDITSATVGSFVDVTGLSVPFIVPTGRKVKATMLLPGVYSTAAAGQQFQVAIREGASALTTGIINQGGSQFSSIAMIEVIITPSTGLHTYKSSLLQNAGAGTFHTSGSATAPGFLKIELV